MRDEGQKKCDHRRQGRVGSDSDEEGRRRSLGGSESPGGSAGDLRGVLQSTGLEGGDELEDEGMEEDADDEDDDEDGDEAEDLDALADGFQAKVGLLEMCLTRATSPTSGRSLAWPCGFLM